MKFLEHDLEEIIIIALNFKLKFPSSLYKDVVWPCLCLAQNPDPGPAPAQPSSVLAAWVMSAQGTVQGWPISAFCDSELKLNIPCIAN